MSEAEKLQRRIREFIPLSEAMQFSIEELSPQAIRVVAPLEPNINIHGTGFAGSIYSLAILTGWALCAHILEQAAVDAELVVAKAQIRYRAPVTGELRCSATAAAERREAFLRGARESGKGVLALDIEVGDDRQAVLDATFCAIRRA
jgi:thioesterase domain-containing protein